MAEIGKGISSVGSNVGLAGTIGAVSAGVAKVLGKSSLPPVQKVGVVVAGYLIGAGIHVGASAINKSTGFTTPTSDVKTSNISDSALKLLPDYTNNSDLINLILSVNMITYACFSLIIILSRMILFKFYLKEDKIKFNLTHSLIVEKIKSNLN